jgi:Cu2+-exporting ATPase
LVIPEGATTAPFCCSGCEVVHGLLVDQGLERYYELADRIVGTPAAAPSGTPTPRAWLDPLLEASSAAAEGELVELDLDVQGVHCSACVWLMEETFRRCNGGGSITVNPAIGRVSLAYRKGMFELGSWLNNVEAFGYRFGPPLKQNRPSTTDLPLRLGVCAALAVNIMLFSVSFYFGLTPAEGEIFDLFSRLSAVLATAVVVIGGWPFFRTAFFGLRRGVAHLDLPIAVGILLVFVTSLARMRDGRGDLAYFDSLAIFITLMLTGRFIQERIIERNRRFLLEDDGVADMFVRRREGERLATVPVAAVRAGDRLIVAPGELIPVACLLAGTNGGAISRDWIDGESEARPVGAGDPVPAGSFNAGAGALELLATEAFTQSALAALLTPRSAGQRPTRAGLRERIGRWWVAGVFLAAATAIAIWWPHGPDRALEITAAVLVVTCPCAIGIALPLAQELTLQRLRRQGFFVRHRSVLDHLPAVRRVVFDKTGTLTLRRLELERPERLLALPDDARRVAYDLAARSSHPASRAIAAALESRGAVLSADFPSQEVVGQGVEVELDGARWRLGRRSWATGAAGDDPVLARGGELVAELGLREVARPDARAEIQRLAGNGVEIWLMSGDDQGRVDRLAASLAIPADRAFGGLSPQAKAERVRALDRADTLYLGDGVNDALAFEAALVAGTPAVDRPVVPGRCDFFLLGEGISALSTAIAGAGSLERVTRHLLAAALLYNALAVSASLAGWVSPLVAAIAMPSSTIALITYTLARLAGNPSDPQPAPIRLAEVAS